jgi:hypothetical protein
MNIASRLSALVLSSTFVLLAGCGSSSPSNSSNTGSGSGGLGQLATGGATSVYVIQNSTTVGAQNFILQFNASSNGTVSPAATLSPPSTMKVDSVATDSSGQIYVGGFVGSQAEILVYASGATGSATPLRTILESASSSVIPAAITVDSAGLIYVAGPGTSSANSIAVFSAAANGLSTPIRLIQGAPQLSSMSDINGIAVDASGNLYVATNVGTITTDTGLIAIFAAGATGNVAPTRTITSSAFFTGIATDASGNIYAAEDTATSTSSTAAIVEFSSGASGAATPSKTISGTATALTFGGGLSRDSAGNIYIMNVANLTTNTPTYNVLGFGPNALGNVAPGANFASSTWTYAGGQIALK